MAQTVQQRLGCQSCPLFHSRHTPVPAQRLQVTRPQQETCGGLHGKGTKGQELRAHTGTCTHTVTLIPYTHARTNTHTHTCTHAHMYTHTRSHLAHTHMHAHTPTCIHRCTHTYPHTHMLFSVLYPLSSHQHDFSTEHCTFFLKCPLFSALGTATD